MSRAAVVRHLLRRNGFRWLLYFAAAELTRRLARAWDRRLQRFETRHRLPGFYDAETQKVVWDGYDWSERGEEWTASDRWKQSVVKAVLERLLDGGDILEIGPGAGRWSVELQKIAHRLTLFDVAASSIEQCRKRLAGSANVRYFVNDGRRLPLQDDEIDGAWSFDVFVHVGEEETAAYLRELRRVLKGGGRAMIHHPADGGLRGQWRSRMSSRRFVELAEEAGTSLRETGDVISVLQKP